MDAYLDIETTGLSWNNSGITVVGILRSDKYFSQFVQLYGKKVSARNLLAALDGVTSVYTYNGRRFDLPFIKASLGVDIESNYVHCDLMYRCWEYNLKGGFKAVEAMLGIDRETKGLNGYDAVLLWQRYCQDNDHIALKRLLKYNQEDTENLRVLRERLEDYRL